MPNWCSNSLTLTHNDHKMIDRAAAAFGNGTFFNEFIPVPSELTNASSPNTNNPDELTVKYGYRDWYSFCTNEWGTKWDVGSGDGYVTDLAIDSINLSFDSAWAPPIAAYEKLKELGFEIYATYHEPSTGFCGIWEAGNDDFYEYGNMTADDIVAYLPIELDESYGISESIREYEQENYNIDLGVTNEEDI